MIKRICLFVLPFVHMALAEEVVYKSMFMDDSSILLKTMFKSLAIVAILLVFLYYWYKVILPGIQGSAQNRFIQVVDRLHIEPATVVYVVQVGEIYHTIVTSNKQVSLLFSGKKQLLRAIPQEITQAKPFKQYFDSFLKKNNITIKLAGKPKSKIKSQK